MTNPKRISEEGGKLLPWPADGESSYGSAFERAFIGLGDRLSQMAGESRGAADLYRELIGRRPEQRRVLVRNSRRYHRLSICEQLLENSLKAVIDEPESALELAELAVEVAERANAGDGWRGLNQDVLARAWAHVGNAHRALRRFEEAEKAFHQSAWLLAQGTGDPLEEAQTLLLRALLAGDQGRLQEAEELLDREIELYGQAGHRQLTGRALVHKATIRARRDDWHQAVALCKEGLALLDPLPDGRLALAGRRYLVQLLEAEERFEEALLLLSRTADFEDGEARRWVRAQARWLGGKIALRSQDWENASHRLEAAVRSFVERGDLEEAARAALDLARVYCHQGRHAAIARLARFLTPSLQQALGGPAALAFSAFVRLERAALTASVTQDLVDELIRGLDASCQAPDLYLALTS